MLMVILSSWPANSPIIWRELSQNVENACAHARALGLASNRVSFFIKTSEFKYYGGEIKLPVYTAEPGVILNNLEKEFPKILPKNKRIRSTGIILHGLLKEESVPMDLFGKQEKTLKKIALEESLDRLRGKYGMDTVKRAASLKKKK